MNQAHLEQMRAHVDEGGTLSHRNGVELLAEVERLRKVLNAIAFATGNMPEAWNDEASWYRSRFYDCVATASRGLEPDTKPAPGGAAVGE